MKRHAATTRVASICCLLGGLQCGPGTARAAEAPGGGPATGNPDPALIYAPFAGPYPANDLRTGSGAPGPGYWQNRADYSIHASIGTPDHVLRGEETVTYTNNSPDPLPVLWMQLEQNIYRADSRARFVSDYARDRPATDGDVVDQVSVEQAGTTTAVTPLVSDTRMQLRLPSPVPPHGGRIAIHVVWHYVIPGVWGGRTAVTPSRNGEIYEIAQWYPRMAVYDDLRGWDTAPYLGQEFYCDYGDFDYAVTVPWNFTVVGSGALINPDEVLTGTERARLRQAATSDQTVMIRTLDDVADPASHAASSGTSTWHFHMTNTRDAVFAASPAFLWDAARIDLPPVVPAPGLAPVPRLAMSVYPEEGIGPHGWDRSTTYVKHAIEYFSSKWFPYPWPDAINLGGHGAGMEYPGLVFDGMDDRDPELFWITTHELGHGWFPMIVGSNERRSAFMDEGFNTFIDSLASDHFNHGEFAPKHDSEYAPETGRPADDIVGVLADPKAPTILEPTDLVPERYRHPVTYFKAAFGLTLLRGPVLGPARFDEAFRRYIGLWAYKHPSPSDFFRAMSSEAGEDLSWFWRGWYDRNWAPDYAVASVAGGANGSVVTIRNRGWLVLPVTVLVVEADGSTLRRTVPSEAWMQGNTTSFVAPGAGQVTSVTIDPDHLLPLVDRAGSVWPQR